MTNKKGRAAEAYIRNGVIVIELPIENIPTAVDGACSMQRIDSPFKVVDAKAFANGVVMALNEEDEEGTTAEDAMLAQKLWIESDEETFKKVANFRRHA